MPASTTPAQGTFEESLFAVLAIDGLTLTLPHTEIDTLEPVFDIRKKPGKKSEAGWFDIDALKVPVYCLDAEMQMQSHIPSSRRVAVLLRTPEGVFGVLCDSVKILPARELRMEPVPECQSGSATLVDALVVVDGKIAGRTTSTRLARHLQVEKQASSGSEKP